MKHQPNIEIIKVKMFTVKKGARDTNGRFIKTGPRFMAAHKGEPGYDKASWGFVHIMMGPRFKVKIPPALSARKRQAKAKAICEQIKEKYRDGKYRSKLRKKLMRRAKAKMPYSVATLKKAGKPRLTNFNPFGWNQ